MHLLETLEDRTLLSFTPISQPDVIYTALTTNMSGSIPPNGDTTSALNDGDQVLTFSSALEAATVPLGGWSTWNSPPAVESDAPRVLFTSDATTTLTVTFSEATKIFGIEVEPNENESTEGWLISVAFMDGSTTVGTVARTVVGDSGALLFAGSTPDQQFTSVVITAAAGANGFAIAQPRYSLADLAIDKTVNLAEVLPGTTLTYTLDVVNNGPSVATNVLVTDPLPPGTTFASVTTAAGWTAVTPPIGTNGTVTFTRSILDSAATASFTITVNVSASAPAGDLVDTATIASDTSDPDPTNNSSTATTEVVSPYLIIVGTESDDQFLIVNGVGGFVDVYMNNVRVAHRLQSMIVQVQIFGDLGNDTLTVSSVNGLVEFTGTDPLVPDAENYIFFDGQEGTNSLILSELVDPPTTPAGPLAAPTPILGELLIVGSEPGSGIDLVSDGTNVQSVYFENIKPFYSDLNEPVFSIEPGVGASVLNASNAINYGEGYAPAAPDTPNPAWGGVTIDGWEPINFTNKTNLIIDTGPGDDVISVINPGTPAGGPPGGPEFAAAGLTGVLINGGEPSASDTLIVNSVPGVSDPLVVEPTAQGAGIVASFNNLFPDVAFTGIEHLTLVGQLADGDPFGVDGTTGNDQFIYTPGATPDTGTVTGTMNQAANAFPLVPISFTGMSQVDEIRFNVFEQVGGEDSFVYNGTTYENVISVADGGVNGIAISNVANDQLYANIQVNNITSAFIKGRGANDTLNVIPVGVTLSVDANGTYEVVGDGTPVIVNMIGPSVAFSGGGLDGLVITGDDIAVNLDNLAGSITVAGTAGPNAFVIAPSGPNSAVFHSHASEAVLITTNTGLLTLSTLGGDTVTLQGTSSNDLITATAGTNPTLQITPVGGPALKTITLAPAGIAALNIDGAAGGDNLLINNTGGAFTFPINFAGGMGGDSLTLVQNASPLVTAVSDTYIPGPAPGSGTSIIDFGAAGTQVVNFTDLAPVIDLVVSPILTIEGSDANNAISYTNGITIGEDTTGLVAVDDQESIQFANKAALVINTGLGKDTVSVNVPTAPTGMTAPVKVNGGDPNSGNTLIYTAYQLGADLGVSIEASSQGAGSVVADLGSPLNVDYTNIAAIQIDGSKFPNAALDIEGTPNNDSVTLTPGATSQSGTITGTMNSPNDAAPLAVPFTLPTVSYTGFLPSTQALPNPFQAIAYDFANGTPSGGRDTFTFNAPAGSDTGIGLISPEKTLVFVGNQLYSSFAVNGIASLNVNLASGGANSVGVGRSLATPLLYDVNVTGSDPSTNSLRYFGLPGGSALVDLSQHIITEPTMGTVSYAGVGTVTVDATGGTLRFASSVSVPIGLIYTPTGVDTGMVTTDPPSSTFYVRAS
ncbi:MAG: DUF11 domain-containing protein [Isosphaeraceae bacterium]